MLSDHELRALTDRVNALCITVEGGFRDLKKDVGYLGKFYVPLAAVALFGLVISFLALAIALENRQLIVSIAHSAELQQERDRYPSYTPVVPSTRKDP